MRNRDRKGKREKKWRIENRRERKRSGSDFEKSAPVAVRRTFHCQRSVIGEARVVYERCVKVHDIKNSCLPIKYSDTGLPRYFMTLLSK